ncbi:MAG: DUF2568 domain-containing protein [Bacteroidota bacterium]
MSTNPYNLVLRLILEFYGYIVFGFTGFVITESILRWPLAILFPVAAGFFWGTFYVEKDPASVGKEIIKISGLQRLVLEFLFYSLTVLLSFIYVSDLVSYIYLYLILIHNIFSHERISWLLKSKSKEEINSPSLG